ncbi:hypothetical protein ACMGD3_07520 [Lysinibacillus sphaericus]|uniref:hypothetical protein n=1 Tax=Lysinibacillus sphaericus TaxID=1421 RepID=UPI003F7A551A
MKAFYKANNFLIEIFKKYRMISTRSEKIFDLVFPLIISIFTFLLMERYLLYSLSDFTKNFLNINAIILTSTAILAGFNTASIAVIAGSQSKLVEDLKNTRADYDPNESKFSVLMVFFTWSILIQLFIILIGILANIFAQFFLESTIKSYLTPNWIYGLFSLWTFIVIHSVLISFRNTKLLYTFVNFKKPDSSE